MQSALSLRLLLDHSRLAQQAAGDGVTHASSMQLAERDACHAKTSDIRLGRGWRGRRQRLCQILHTVGAVRAQKNNLAARHA